MRIAETTESQNRKPDPALYYLGNYIPHQFMNDPRPPMGTYSGASPGMAWRMMDPANYGMGCVINGGPASCSTVRGGGQLDRLLNLFLPRLNPMGSLGNFPNTPTTFPNSQITLGSIFRDATQGTALGDFLYPKLDWSLINPTFPWGSLYANPQNPAIQDAVTPNDCYALVSQVRKIARDTNVYLAGGNGGSDIVQKFMDRLATTFTEFVDASSLGQSIGLVGIENSSADANRNRYSDVGFKEEFQDHIGPGFSDNQVRHTIGGLIAGYVGVPVLFMDRREDMSTPSGQADTRLNRVTMPMGEKLKSSGGSAALGLADWIKRTLCDPLRR